MSLESIIYVSSGVEPLSDADLESLLSAARSNNETFQITGVLLYHDGNFFQYLEGPSVGVQTVYGYIQQSKLHQGIIELDRETISQRVFPSWLMGFNRVSGSMMLQLSNASWKASLDQMLSQPSASKGMVLLLDFWRLNR
jgi:hypothetical protein